MVNNSQSHVVAILAMSLDGKISFNVNQPARFSSQEDLKHLETQISFLDAIIFGGNTLRAYGTSLVIKDKALLAQREARNQPPQPLNIVCSNQGNINPHISFFSQPLPRALLTTSHGLINWQKNLNNEHNNNLFHDFFTFNDTINWHFFFNQLAQLKYHKIGILGGGKLITSLIKEGLINELWLTICPLIIGDGNAPSFLDSIPQSIELELLESKQINQEIFVHYLIK